MTFAFILLLAGAMVLALVFAIWHASKVHKTVAKHVSKTHVSQAVTALLVVGQLSEVTKVFQHISLVHVVAAVFILAMILATRSGTEAELH